PKTSAARYLPRVAVLPSAHLVTAASWSAVRHLGQVLLVPAQRVLPRLLGGLRVVALAGVIEERMAGSGEGANFISEASRLERCLRSVSGRVHSFVLLPVDPIDSGLGLPEVRIFGRGPVERDSSGHALFTGLEQVPRHATAEAEADHPDLRIGHSLLELVDAGLGGRKKVPRRGGREGRRRGRWVAERPSSALSREQIDA